MKKGMVIKSQNRGPSDDRLDDIELGFAYALAFLTKTDEYEDLKIVYEYDRIAYEDICSDIKTGSNRWMRARKAYIDIRKKNQLHKPGKKIDLKKYEDGKIYVGNKEDPLYDTIRKLMQRCRKNKLRRFIEESDKCLNVDERFDKEKVIHLLLDSYPDPIFFKTEDFQPEDDWNAKLMKQIFGTEDEDNFFWVSTPGGGVLPISSLSYELEDYKSAIESYIRAASWKEINKKYNVTNFVKVFNLEVEGIKRIKLGEKPAGICSWGEYQVVIDGRRNKQDEKGVAEAIKIGFKAPKYDKYEADFIEYEMYDYNHAHEIANYPLLLFTSFHYKYWTSHKFKKNQDYYNDNLMLFWNNLYSKIEKRRWSGTSLKVSDIDLVFPHQFSWDKEWTYLFVLKPTVRNARIIKNIFE